MIDFQRVQGFDWDSGNRRKNEKHGVTMSEAEEVFFNMPLLVLEDPKHSQSEMRLHALGKTDLQSSLHVSFTLRANETLIRVISVRDMSKKERTIYEKSAQENS